MACTVYREGKGTIEHGIECESQTVEIQYLESMLSGGWSLNPPGYVAPEPEPQDEKLTEEERKEHEQFEHEAMIASNAESKARDEEREYYQPIIDNLEQQVEKLELINANLEEQVAELKEEKRAKQEADAAEESESESAEPSPVSFDDPEDPGHIEDGSSELPYDEVATDEVVTPVTQGQPLNLSEASPEEIRAAAREAGIPDWDSKRIKTLKAELEA